MSLFSEQALPSADDIAHAILASAMHDPRLAERAVEVLKPDDFLTAATSGDILADVFQAIASLVDKGKRASPVTIDQEMKRLGLVHKGHMDTPMKLTPFLQEISRSYSAGAAIDEYCALLHTYGYRRRLHILGAKLRDLAGVEGMDLAQYMAQAEAEFGEVSASANHHSDQLITMGDILRERMEEHRNRKPGEFIGLRTGFPELDRYLCGMRSGDYFVIAARPAVGKTTLAEDILAYNAEHGNVGVMFPLEMQRGQLGDRTIAAVGGVNGRELRAGLVAKDRLDHAESQLQRKGMFKARYFLDWKARTVPEMRRFALRVKREHGLHLIVIDYLQLMRGHGRYGKSGNRVQEVGEISRDLKALALELGVTIIVVSQLNRGLEHRKGDEDKRPQLSDLRDTGDIEQDADVVAMLYREGAGNPQSTNTTTEVILRKNRNGPLGTVELEFVGDRTTFLSKHGR